MRIAVWHDLPPGGARRAFNELLKRLAPRHMLTIFQLGASDKGPFQIDAHGLPVKLVPFEPRLPVPRAAFYNEWLAYKNYLSLDRIEQKLGHEIDRESYDLVLVSALRWGHAPAILEFLCTPSVYYSHETLRRFYEPKCRPEAAPLSNYDRWRLRWRWPSRFLLDTYIRKQDARRVRAANLVLTNSRYSVERIEQVYDRPAKISYLGVDTDFFHPAPSQTRSNSVVSVGAFEAHKGFDFVIRAIGRMPVEHRPELNIVGMGGYHRMPDFLRALAQQEGVKLKLRSEVSDHELLGMYQSASLFVFAAHHEPFGLVVLEAMACGIPVVAVAEGGVPEMVQDGQTGHLTERDRQAFARSIEGLMRSEDRRVRMGEAARLQAVERWSWEKAAQRLESHLTLDPINQEVQVLGVEA